MLVEQIDTICLEASKHSFYDQLDMLWPAIQTFKPLACVLIEIPAEFRLDYDFVAQSFECFTNDILGQKRPICFSGVYERHPLINRPADERNCSAPFNVLAVKVDRCAILWPNQPLAAKTN